MASSHLFNFPWSKDLAKGWSVGGMESFFWNTMAGRRNLIWEPTLMAEKELLGSWSVFVEYAGDFAQQGGSKQIAHFTGGLTSATFAATNTPPKSASSGTLWRFADLNDSGASTVDTAYRITSRQQIDCHVGFGISPAAPEHFLAIGYSIRLDDVMGTKNTEYNVQHGMDRSRN
jgi:hypothetical protein